MKPGVLGYRQPVNGGPDLFQLFPENIPGEPVENDYEFIAAIADHGVRFPHAR